MWNRKSPNMTNRATSRRNRYSSDALASGGRPSQTRPSTAPPRCAARASGEMRPGGVRPRFDPRGASGAVMSGRSRAALFVFVGVDVGGWRRVAVGRDDGSRVLRHVLLDVFPFVLVTVVLVVVVLLADLVFVVLVV